MGKFHLLHGKQSNLPHMFWAGSGFVLGLVLYGPMKDLLTYLFFRN
jgi:hypothetical protein